MKNREIAVVAVLVVLAASAAFVFQAANPQKIALEGVVAERTFQKESDFFYNYEITRYPSSAEVVELRQENTFIGFDVAADRLNFGVIPSGGSFARKLVNLTNLIGKDSRIVVDVRGDISPYVNLEKNDFVLREGETEDLEIFFYSEKDQLSAAVGNYTGEISITIQIPKYDIVYSLWGYS